MPSEDESHICNQADRKTGAFTFDEYLHIFNILAERKTQYFLRHDVDLSMKKALQMAELDREIGIRSSFFILLNSDFFNPFTPENVKIANQIIDFGHKISVHIDQSALPADPFEQGMIIAHLTDSYSQLIHQEIDQITFHRPKSQGEPSRDLVVALARINLHYPNLNKEWHYISDSGMKWREDPYSAAEIYGKLHINIHPEWWDWKEGTMKDRVYSLRLEQEMDEKVYNKVKSIQEYLDNR